MLLVRIAFCAYSLLCVQPFVCIVFCAYSLYINVSFLSFCKYHNRGMCSRGLPGIKVV